MSEPDWDAQATLHERDDGGSELQYNFAVLAKGSLRAMVAHVVAMEPAQRARVVIEVAGGKSMGLGDILELAAKEGLA